MVTQWLEDAEKDLKSLREYIRDNNLESTPDAIREIAMHENLVKVLRNAPIKWIVASGLEATLLNYLGFGARVNTTLPITNNKVVVTIAIPAEHANWQSMRLHSGLLGGMIFDSFEEASIAQHEVAALCLSK